MPKKKSDEQTIEELLTKLIALTMWQAGATQGVIAVRLGKGKAWVNSFLQGVPRTNPAPKR